MHIFPYALPNLVTGTFLFLSIFLVMFGLEEVSPEKSQLYLILQRVQAHHTPPDASRSRERTGLCTCLGEDDFKISAKNDMLSTKS